MRRRLVSFVVAGLVVQLAACGGTESDGAPTTTVVAPATTVEVQPDSDAGLFPAGEPVDLVYISDSGGAEVAERYAELTAEALDREVRLHDHRIGGMSMSRVPALVRENLAEVVAEAEIIVLYAHPGGLEYNLPEPNFLTCFEAVDALEDPDYSGPEWDPAVGWVPPAVPSVENWQPYRDVLDEVYAEIWKQREGRPVVLRGHDIYNGFIAPWMDLGIEPECTANWEIESQVIREAAEANGAEFVSFFDVFNGPNHDEDPREKGWIADDGMHANAEGGAVAAEALAIVGYELSEPPLAGEFMTLTTQPEGVSAVAWSPDGAHLVTATGAIDGRPGIAKVWAATTGDELLSFDIGDFETSEVVMAYSPDGTRLALGGPTSAVYDASTGEELLGELPALFLAYSPDGTRLAVGGAWGWAAVLDAGTGDERLTLSMCPSWVWAAAWNSDGTSIATTCATTVRVWDASTGDELLTIGTGTEVTDLAWSPDGTRIATAGHDGRDATIWDADSGDELVTLTGHTGGVWAVAWCPDGTRIATSGGDATAKIWDAATGGELDTITGHTAVVTGVAWSPDGTRIATASDDGTVRIWSLD